MSLVASRAAGRASINLEVLLSAIGTYKTVKDKSGTWLESFLAEDLICFKLPAVRSAALPTDAIRAPASQLDLGT